MQAARKILIVDDDAALRQSLAEQLDRDGEFVSSECGCAAEALDTIGRERFDAILLDVGLPDMDGRDLCRKLRSEAVSVPIVMLTAADSDGDTVQGLDAGANDYVTKPFRLNVLLARLRAHLRQSERRDDAVFAIGPYTFRPGAKLMTDSSGRKKVRLTEKETAILQISLPRGRSRHRPIDLARRGLGLQCRRDDAYARNPCLPFARRRSSAIPPTPRSS